MGGFHGLACCVFYCSSNGILESIVSSAFDALLARFDVVNLSLVRNWVVVYWELYLAIISVFIAGRISSWRSVLSAKPPGWKKDHARVKLSPPFNSILISSISQLQNYMHHEYLLKLSYNLLIQVLAFTILRKRQEF